jgi:hypothetical protein
MNRARAEITPKDNRARGQTKNGRPNDERKDGSGAAMSWFKTHLDFNVNAMTATIMMRIENNATIPSGVAPKIAYETALAAIITWGAEGVCS